MAKTIFKYEKEYNKDNRICKRCGKKQDYACIAGLCDKCQNAIIQENTRKTPNLTITDKEAQEMGVR